MVFPRFGQFSFALLVFLAAQASLPNIGHTTTARSRVRLLAADLSSVDDRIAVSPNDWPWWRGTQRNGVANPNQSLPRTWSETENVLWASAIPGRGHSSPTVVGDHVYLVTSDEEANNQSVLCYDRATGSQLWETVVHRGGAMRKNQKSCAASGTVACDGERLFICFANGGAVHATALSRDGQQLWQQKIVDYQIHQGYGASPAIYQSLVIVSADSKAGGAVAGLDRVSGEIRWRKSRPPVPNYSSPILLRIGGRDQLLLTGCDLVSSFEPLTGDTIWETAGATTECVTSTVTDGTHIFSSGGYPKNHLAAVRADGSAQIVWETKNRVYVPSLLVRDGYLYGVLDAGVATCWKCDTGEEVWTSRLGGTFSASPVLVGETIYVTNESGETFIYAARPTRPDQVQRNQLGDEVFATPAICGGRIYMRVARQVDGKRSEFLYCLGK